MGALALATLLGRYAARLAARLAAYRRLEPYVFTGPSSRQTRGVIAPPATQLRVASACGAAGGAAGGRAMGARQRRRAATAAL